jgi:cephalosporin hydroxylase
MYPFWEPLIAPLVKRSAANRIVEVGALRGETTVRMLEDLGPGAELHVIDPLPQFDPGEHERRFPGQYVFHRDLSLNVLPGAAAFDVALLDGDHNWYTIYHELQHLRDSARAENRALPLLILHDVGWPYGRRDLYYAPSQIPDEFRQPHAQRGMTPGRARLLKQGGMNITLDNALEEGGERNGVLTGLDDFIAEHDRPIRKLIIPIYYGLAIVAEEAYLDDHPEVREMFDELESLEGVTRLLQLSESIRIDEVVFSHNIERMRNDRLTRAVDRHLSLLRASLLDEHYVENEARINVLLDAATRRRPIDTDKLRDPRRNAPQRMRELDLARRQGDPAGSRGHFAFTDIGRISMDHLDEALRAIETDGVVGDLVEVGCGRGGIGIYMRGLLDAHEIEERDIWIVDEFRAAPRTGARPIAEAGVADLWPDLSQVRDGFERFELLDERVHFVQGPPAESVAATPTGPVALLRIGRSVGADTPAILDALRGRLAPGAIVIVEDTVDDATRAAIEAHCRANGVTERLGWSTLAWRHTADDDAPATPTPILTNPAGSDTVELSVVVVFHNMQREAERTLHSLSRSYQRGIDDLTYEVIAIDNGSAADQRLNEETVRSFGPEFRLISIGDSAASSPVPALNEGLRQSTGQHIAFMIDGAHMLSPGVLRHGLTGLRSYSPAIVATQQWYIGPGQQPDVVAEGYDQSVEDLLFHNIEWPSDGYRLFEISHFIGERDWLDGILESNCLFAPRTLLEQVGAFDEAFLMPGGGYANLELYERLGAHPGVSIVTILGEGSFHQVHGGTTTNDGERTQRREKTFGYGEHYRDLRGRTLGGPAKHINYVGSFTTRSAARTRSRHLTAMAFDPGGRDAATQVPTDAVAMPDELKSSLISGVWHTLAWQKTTWAGEAVGGAPTDLMIYQELIDRIRPDHVIVTGRDGAGSARFAATICEMLEHGTVISVGNHEPAAHPRLVHVPGGAHTPAVVAKVQDILGDCTNALVILGSGAGADGLKKEFAAYAPYTAIGSYVIFENTIVNGRPVWPGYGPGPLEAIRSLLPQHGEFMADTSMERFGLTFNAGGYLRRIA